MSISTRPFHPLDAENNRRYKVTKGKYEDIPFRDAEGDEPHVWKGYIRVPDDTTCQFSIDLLGHGYIEIGDKKVIDVKETLPGIPHNGEKFIKKGYHHITVYYQFYSASCQNPTSHHPEVFSAKMGGKLLEIWDIDEPKNLWKVADAKKLLGCYNVVDYPTMNNHEVYAHIGGWIFDEHQKEIQEGIPEADRKYDGSCALRLSIALSNYGYNLQGAEGAVSIGSKGNTANLGGKSFVILGAGHMGLYLEKILGKSDYPNCSDTGYSTPQDNDIVVFGNSIHVGMSPGTEPSVGSFQTGTVWLLNRETLDDEPEKQE